MTNQNIFQILRRLQKLSGYANTQLDSPPHVFKIYNNQICTESGEELDTSVVLEFMNLAIASINAIEEELSEKRMLLDKIKRLAEEI